MAALHVNVANAAQSNHQNTKRVTTTTPKKTNPMQKKTRTFGSSSGDTGMTSEGADFLPLI